MPQILHGLRLQYILIRHIVLLKYTEYTGYCYYVYGVSPINKAGIKMKVYMYMVDQSQRRTELCLIQVSFHHSSILIGVLLLSLGR